MTETTKIFFVAHVPAGLEKAWLQHMRNFDTANPGCHFEIMLEKPNATLLEMIEMLVVDPELSVTQVWKRG